MISLDKESMIIVQIGETLFREQNTWDSFNWPEPELYRPFVSSSLQNNTKQIESHNCINYSNKCFVL